ncbi:hypothetical protein KI387_014055, partial [Taxus chinensis]
SIEGMSGRRGAWVKVKAEGTLNETGENPSRGGKVSQKDCNNASREGQNKMGCSDQNQSAVQRRMLRSHYHALKTSIAEQKEDILKTDSSEFDSIFNKVESLHNLVQKPREQVADAEALFDITATLFATVKRSQNSDGVTSADFISSILTNFSGQANGSQPLVGNDQLLISWGKLGCLASSVFQDASGISTMLGPMDSEPKQRKAIVSRKRTKPTEKTRPEAVKESEEDKSETDKNMATMFNILRKQKRVRLECLVLNRISFSQTVENIFALSFLVKDGRVELSLDENRNHFVEPKNAPTSKEIQTGEAAYSQFVFRFDFRDWKLMIDAVESGMELMPHRTISDMAASPENAAETPIRKLSRNRGRVVVGTEDADD